MTGSRLAERLRPWVGWGGQTAVQARLVWILFCVLTVLGLVDIAVLNLRVLPLCFSEGSSWPDDATPGGPARGAGGDLSRTGAPSIAPTVGDAAPSAPLVAATPEPRGSIVDAGDESSSGGVVTDAAAPAAASSSKQGERWEVLPLRFETGSWALTGSCKRRLTKVATIMRENPELRVLFQGHADDRGSEETNLDLSEDRAEAAANYLLSKGIAPDRVSYAGVGESQPVDRVRSNAARARNRRVEVIWR